MQLGIESISPLQTKKLHYNVKSSVIQIVFDRVVIWVLAPAFTESPLLRHCAFALLFHPPSPSFFMNVCDFTVSHCMWSTTEQQTSRAQIVGKQFTTEHNSRSSRWFAVCRVCWDMLFQHDLRASQNLKPLEISTSLPNWEYLSFDADVVKSNGKRRHCCR